MIRDQGLGAKLAHFRRRAGAIPIPPFIKAGALIALGVAPFAFFVALQSANNPNEQEQAPTQPVGEQRIPLAFPFGTPEPSPLPSESTTTTSKPSTPTQCDDGRDNDRDGRIDLADRGCVSRRDTSEVNAVATTRARATTRPVATTTTAPPATTTQPPTTAAPAASTDPPDTTSPPETQPPTTSRRVQGECSDGIDNDNDGKTDLDDKASCHGNPADDE